MSDDLFHFTITVPAGTPLAAPVTTTTRFRSSIVERITWRLPPGSAGTTGFQIASRGVQVYPRTPGQFIIGEGNSGGFDIHGAHDSGDWSVIAYNTGAFDHSIYVTYHVRTIRKPEPILGLAHDLALSHYSSQAID